MANETSADTPPAAASSPRAPSLLDALIPLGTLIGLIVLTIALFGTDATSGPLQVALLTSAVVAGLVAFKNGYSASRIREAAIGGVSSGMSALFILLAVGALIGTWNMAGTIPTVVYFGLGLLSATWFYPATAIVCGVVGLAIGSSWTTAATLGVAFVALAPLVGADPAIAAGAVISGAYFGDKMTPVSETTVLVPSMVGGVTTNQHIGAMVWTSGPAVVIAIVLFTILGLATPATGPGFDSASAQAVLAGEFSIGLINMLPLFLLVAFSILRIPPFLSIFSCALFAGVLASFTQPELVAAFVNEPGQGPLLTGIEAVYAAMANGFVSVTGNETIDALFSRGGMAGMLTTIWLILGALSYAAIMEEAGFLDRLIRPIVAHAKSTGRLIAAVVGTCIGLNIIAGDQYVAIVMPSRVYRAEFAHRGIAPRMLSRAVRGFRHGHLSTRAVEQLRRLHGRRARRCHDRVPAILLLQSGQPHHLAPLRVHGLQDRARPADGRAAHPHRTSVRRHRGVLLVGLEPAVEQAQLVVGKHFLLEAGVLGDGGLGVDLVRLFDQRKDDERLPALFELAAHVGVAALALGGAQQPGGNGLAARRHLVQKAQVKIAVDGQRQRARDGRGGHHQQVRVRALAAQGGALGHAKPVLFVHDHQAQVGKLHRPFDQRVRAHHRLDRARAQPGIHLFFFQRGARPLQQPQRAGSPSTGASSCDSVRKCCSARMLVGAMMAAWAPAWMVTAIAAAATAVLPSPRRPAAGGFMGTGRAMSARISATARCCAPVRA